MSIFQDYYKKTAFIDRYASNPDGSVDVIIPIIHTNEVWEANLFSFYREIPIRRLLIGDGGCVDDSLKIARKFPRVEVLDHRAFISLGFSIRKLIEAVQTEWFVYLHSDVYLPDGWFDAMRAHQGEFDWFQCRQRATALIEFDAYDENAYASRAYSGSQMGRRAAFEQVLPGIDDDFLYRNEDIIIADLIQQTGHKYGHAADTFHYHQNMYKQSQWKRNIVRFDFKVETSPEEELRAYTMQVKGLIKYILPTTRLMPEILACMDRLQEVGAMDWEELILWSEEVHPAWLPLLKKQAKKEPRRRIKRWIVRKAKKVINLL